MVAAIDYLVDGINYVATVYKTETTVLSPFRNKQDPLLYHNQQEGWRAAVVSIYGYNRSRTYIFHKVKQSLLYVLVGL